MKTIYVHLSIGYPTATHSDELEFEDEATDEEINRDVQEWANNYIEISWGTEKLNSRFR
jgi:hypothetical protein